jgi:thiamine biosynthesis lipoprotein
MGTVLEITLVVRNPRRGRDLLEETFAAAAGLERLLSRHLPASEVTALNQAAGGDTLPLSPATTRALRSANRYAQLTGGAFDVTVGPLVELWTLASRLRRLPSEAELAAARALVGSAGLIIKADGSARLARRGMALDLGGLGKGFALDELGAQLHGQVEGALLDFGRSSMVAFGKPAHGDVWRVLVGGGPGEPSGTLVFSERALSISSSLGQYTVIENRRYGHVVDPRSGLALQEGRFAAVLAGSAAEAEAWSTALLVLSRGEAARRLSRRPDVAAAVHGEGGRLLHAGDLEGLSLEARLPRGAAP